MIDILSIETNAIIIEFVTNNAVLLFLIHHGLKYVCKKTPWAWDDNLPSFFKGAIDKIKGWKNG